MFKETKLGQTNYCLSCEKKKKTGHTCGIINQESNVTTGNHDPSRFPSSEEAREMLNSNNEAKGEKCEPNDLMYTSNPPQYKCKNCGRFWFVKDATPICKATEINTIFPTPQNKESIRISSNHRMSASRYTAIHYFLRKNFIRPKKCESPDCLGLSPIIEWALIKGKRYAKKRENFMALCRRCHAKYDMTEATKRKISRTSKGRPSIPEQVEAQYKAVFMCDQNSNKIKRFPSVRHASNETGLPHSNISNCARGQRLYSRMRIDGLTTKIKWIYE